MGPDNPPILKSMRVKNFLVLQSCARTQASPSGGSRIASRKYHSSAPTFLGKREASRLGWLAVGSCQLKGAATN